MLKSEKGADETIVREMEKDVFPAQHHYRAFFPK
jgi:hypothetical protein